MAWLWYLAVALSGAGLIGVSYFLAVALIRSPSEFDRQMEAASEAALEGDLREYVRSLNREAAE